MALGSWAVCGACRNKASNAIINKGGKKYYLCTGCFEKVTGQALYPEKKATPTKIHKEEQKKCAACGAVFQNTRNRKYCSTECSKMANRSRTKVKHRAIISA